MLRMLEKFDVQEVVEVVEDEVTFFDHLRTIFI